jgi:hypothetical protein
VCVCLELNACDFLSNTNALDMYLAFRTHGESRDRSPCDPFASWLAARTRTSGFDKDNSVTVDQRVGGRLPPPWR